MFELRAKELTNQLYSRGYLKQDLASVIDKVRSTHLSPFVLEKQIESIIGKSKSVKKLKNKTLLIETTRRAQTENLLKMKKFFNLKVTVSEHKTLNTSKGIIKDRALKGESEKDICDYLKNQGVIAV